VAAVSIESIGAETSVSNQSVALCHIVDESRRRVSFTFIQSVPLPTKPGISLIILKPMKILQRDLNSSTFVVWEM